MKRILLAAAALALAGGAAVSYKAFRYRKDAQLWYARYNALHRDPGGLDHYRDDNARLRREGARPGRVVFLGASITEALDFARLFPNEPLVNRGVGGQLVWQQWLRLEPDALSLSPSAVVLKTCAINMLPDAPPLEETQRYFSLMMESVRRHGARVVVATAVPVSRRYDATEGEGHVAERIQRFNAWLRAEAERNHDTVLDYAAALADAQGYLPDNLSEDGLHPNAEGKQRMADAIRRVVVEGIVHAVPPSTPH